VLARVVIGSDTLRPVGGEDLQGELFDSAQVVVAPLVVVRARFRGGGDVDGGVLLGALDCVGAPGVRVGGQLVAPQPRRERGQVGGCLFVLGEVGAGDGLAGEAEVAHGAGGDLVQAGGELVGVGGV